MHDGSRWSVLHEEKADLRELAPIKLIGGFVAVDAHVGCIGCPWCLSRRNPLWVDAFARGLHADPPAVTPGTVAALLATMPSINRARVPLRFGHNTDAALQWDFGARLYRLMPAQQPFVFMTRFPLDAERRALFADQPNLLCKVSLSPASRLLPPAFDAGAVLRSLEGVPTGNLYFLVGPIAADGVEGAAELLRRLPPGAWADVKPLTRDGIAPVQEVPLPSDAQLADLRELGTRLGLTITDFFGCTLRRRLGRPFYKADAAPPYVARACAACAGRSRCAEPVDGAIDAIRRDARRWLGLRLGPATPLGRRVLRFQADEPCSRGDETFLSELHRHQVQLSTVPAGSEGGSFCREDDAVLARWEQTGFFPSRAVLDLAAQVRAELKR